MPHRTSAANVSWSAGTAHAPVEVGGLHGLKSEGADAHVWEFVGRQPSDALNTTRRPSSQGTCADGTSDRLLRREVHTRSPRTHSAASFGPITDGWKTHRGARHTYSSSLYTACMTLWLPHGMLSVGLRGTMSIWTPATPQTRENRCRDTRGVQAEQDAAYPGTFASSGASISVVLNALRQGMSWQPIVGLAH